MSSKKLKELDKRAFLISVADKLKEREVSHLKYLTAGVILSREVTDQVHTFLELVDAMEKNHKIDEAMKDWQVLYDILEVVKRKDLVNKIKEFGEERRLYHSQQYTLRFCTCVVYVHMYYYMCYVYAYIMSMCARAYVCLCGCIYIYL